MAAEFPGDGILRFEKSVLRRMRAGVLPKNSKFNMQDLSGRIDRELVLTKTQRNKDTKGSCKSARGVKSMQPGRLRYKAMGTFQQLSFVV